jgi:CheY-like chemotaxis protein
MTVIKTQLLELGKLNQCEFVYNGEEAVCKYSELVLAGQTVSFVLTDFMMPRLNGI